MKKATSVAVLIISCLSAANFASAKEPYLKFLRALQENGYGDVALEYIDRIANRPDLPPELRDTLDLERSTSLRVASQNAYDMRQSEQYLADAQKYLDKFLADHPDHPAAAFSILYWGDSLFELGQKSLASARRTTEAQPKAKFFAETREYFTKAGERYTEAQKRFSARMKQLPADEWKQTNKPGEKNQPLSGERQEAEKGLAQAAFRLSLVKYHLAQTYDDQKSPERLELLKTAAKGFDAIYQQYRLNTEDERCIDAHLWQGKVEEELGNDQTALDIFEEVIGSDDKSDSALAPIYTQATFYRYGILRKLGKIEDLVAEGSKWIELHKSWAKLPFFNGAVLEVGKALQEQASKASGDAQRKIVQKGVILLADPTKIDSPYRSDIILLRRDLLKLLGSENVGTAELLALGDASLRDNNLADAKQNYDRALKKALDSKDQKSVEEAKRSLARLALREAQALFDKRNYDDALKAAEAMAQGDAAESNTIGAAELALRSAYFSGVMSPDKENPYGKLQKVADFVKNKWPGRPVADTARMILAESQLQKGDIAAALKLFREVLPESSRYPWALYSIGRIEWFTYLEEKKKEGGGNQAAMADAQAKASESLAKCVDLLQRSLAPGKRLTSEENSDPAEDARVLQLIADAQVLQSEILLEAKKYQEALAILDPLLEKIKTDPSRPNDSSSGIFTSAIRARLALGDAEKASQHALALLALMEDEPKANAKLVNVARLLNQELKTADAAVTEAEGGDPKTLETAAGNRNALKENLRKFVEPLGKRKEQSLSDLVFLGSVCFSLDLTDEGGQIYQNLLDRAKDDPTFAKKAEAALVVARSQLIGVLRTQGKLDEALKQADELIAKKPRALEPKMAKAYILEDLSKANPKKLEETVTQWNEIRLLLNRVNPKPPEYFDVVLKIAGGLYRQFETSKDRTKLDTAEQMLKSTLVQYSKLSGPDMVAKYNDLLKKIDAAKGKKKAETKK